jgi:hypothetical protein
LRIQKFIQEIGDKKFSDEELINVLRIIKHYLYEVNPHIKQFKNFLTYIENQQYPQNQKLLIHEPKNKKDANK